nr:D-aminoacyl-tRNA deacylase [bacterium]
MRCVVQRAATAKVEVEGQIVGQIGRGLMVLVGFCQEDGQKDIDWMAHKLAGLRIFEDAEGKMNKSVRDIDGSLLLVSQFTLYGDATRGFRPSFIGAAPADHARGLFDDFVARMREEGLPVETGVFQADMQVSLVNDGPVTIWLDTKA